MTKHFAEQFALLGGDQPEPPAIDGKAEIVSLGDLAPTETVIASETPPAKGDLLVNRYHRNAVAAVGQGACWMVLAGLELFKAKKESKRGAWSNWVELNCEYSIRTAQKYMALADGMKTHALKTNADSFLALLSCAPSDLSAENTTKLMDAVEGLTDGHSVQQLYEDFGIVKPKKPLGGNRVKADAEEDATEITPEQAARDLWIPILDGIKREGISERSWMHLSDEDRTALKGLLTDVLDCINGKLK